MYTDIKKGFLFVGYAEDGIAIYSLTDPIKPSFIGMIDSRYFDDEKNSSSKTYGTYKEPRIIFYDFNIRPYHIGIVESKNGKANLKECPSCRTFYNVEFSLQDRVDWIKGDVMEKHFMVIGTNLSVRFLDLTTLYEDKKLPERLYKHKLDIPYAYKITRFQDMLYIMSRSKDEMNKDTKPVSEWWENQKVKEKDIYEIYLTDTTLDLWDKPDNSIKKDDRYIINRRIESKNSATNIYVDEDYLYTYGDKVQVFYERGISSKFLPEISSISKVFLDKGL